MTPEELAEWRKKYGHLSMKTMDNAANLRLSSCDAELDLGPLLMKKPADYVYFILTDGRTEYPLKRICVLLCTPDAVLCEFLNAGEENNMAIMDVDCVPFLEHLKNMGYRSLTDEEYLILSGGVE